MSKQLKTYYIVLSAIMAVLLLCIMFFLIFDSKKVKDVLAGTAWFSQSDLDRAYDEGYAAGVGDKEALETRIAELEQELVDLNNEWQEKYDNMVEEYEEKIAELNAEIQERIAYIRILEDYITNFNLDEYGMSNSLSALNLVLAAYKDIKAGQEDDFTYWQGLLAEVPDLVAERARYNKLAEDKFAAEKAVNDSKEFINDYPALMAEYREQKAIARKLGNQLLVDAIDILMFQAENEYYINTSFLPLFETKLAEITLEHKTLGEYITEQTGLLAVYEHNISGIQSNLITLSEKITELEEKISELEQEQTDPGGEEPPEPQQNEEVAA